MRFLRTMLDALMGTSPPPATKDVRVGIGASNEAQLAIGGIPHLFRKEASGVAHFVATFERVVGTTDFGQKLLPSVVPYWKLVSVSQGLSLGEAVELAVRAGKVPEVASPHASSRTGQEGSPAARTESTPMRPATPTARAESGPGDARHAEAGGTLKSWGVATYPDRKKPGRSYESFTVWLETPSGERSLHGEGLKDALAEAGCKVGDSVRIKRLRKVKVQAFRASGDPELDAKGNQIFWDKWLWSVSRIH